MLSRKPKPRPKPRPNFRLLTELTKLGYAKIVGIDEVGRGAIAGPLVVAAIELPVKIIGITDSKLLTKFERERLAKQIHLSATQISFGQASASEIDQLGLTAATKLAYERALEAVEADLILTDFVRLPGRTYISQPQGDRYFYPVAAASIVAKVYRDQLMSIYHQASPQYGWATNVGYGTAEHHEALKVHGRCSLHRRGFLH